jgi:Zn-dependent protease/DNA-directed RNA polymerase subunit RPC12/RpoP
MPGRQGSIRLFRLLGIDVFLHWSWFLVALFEINARSRSYSSFTWNVLEYLALFLIVLLHEFGHALACRQVGGAANQIVLWPLGGVAYVNPPPRPGATLWSIAAGPLVNVVLVPLLFALGMLSRSWLATSPDVYVFLHAIWVTNLVLLVFNLMPVYPLDGGQILRSLLWFVMGRARSLMVAAVIGLFGVVGFFALAFWMHSVWFGIVAVFLLMNCWGGLRHARNLSQFAKLPRRQGVACPSCKAAPPLGEFWNCSNCKQPFDTFATHAVCPYCSSQFDQTRCPDCGQLHSMAEWMGPLVTEAKA